MFFLFTIVCLRRGNDKGLSLDNIWGSAKAGFKVLKLHPEDQSAKHHDARCCLLLGWRGRERSSCEGK